MEAASACAHPLRQHAARVRLASPENRRDRRPRRVLRRARPHRAPLGHTRAPANRGPSQGGRGGISAVSRRHDDGRWHGSSGARRTRTRALAARDRPQARREAFVRGAVALENYAAFRGRERRAVTHVPAARVPPGSARDRAAVCRHDRRRAALHRHREPVFYRASDRRGAGCTARGAGWAGDHRGAAAAESWLARRVHHAEPAPQSHRSAAEGGSRGPLPRLLPLHRRSAGGHLHRCALQGSDRG
jgi:hypothetical protein